MRKPILLLVWCFLFLGFKAYCLDPVFSGTSQFYKYIDFSSLDSEQYSTLNVYGNIYETNSKYYFNGTLGYKIYKVEKKGTLSRYFTSLAVIYGGITETLITETQTWAFEGNGTHYGTCSQKKNQEIEVIYKYHTSFLEGYEIKSWPQTFYYDGAGPTLTVSSSSAWSNTRVGITASATDGGSGLSSISYSYEGGSGTVTSGSTFYVSEVGSTVVTITAKDNLGNSTTKSTTVNIDTTPPDLTLSAASDWQKGPVDITVAADGGLSGLSTLVYSYPGQSSTDVLDGKITVSREGTTEVTVIATDGAKNTTTKTITVNIDNTKPTLTLSADTGWHNDAVDITVTADGGLSGLSSLVYSYPGKPESDVPDNHIITISDEGSTVVSVKAIDGAGNTTTETITVNIDNTDPTLTLSADPGWQNEAVEITVTANGGLSGLASLVYSYPGKTETAVPEITNSDGTISRIITVSEEGTTIVSVKATDGAGNTKTATQTVYIDKIKPVITIPTIPSWLSNDEYTVNATASDLHLDSDTWAYEMDNGTTILSGKSHSVTVPAWFPGEESPVTVTFTVEDAAGNEGSLAGIVKMDGTAPIINKPFISPWYDHSPILSFTATDPLSGLDSGSWNLELSGVESRSVSGSSVTITKEGTTNIDISVSDIVGNQANDSCVVNIDLTAPVISLPGETLFDDYFVNYDLSSLGSDSGSGIDLSTWEYKIDSDTWINSSFFNLNEEGFHPVLFRVKDNAGIESQTVQWDIVIDKTPPELSLTGNSNWTDADSVTISATVEDIASGVDSLKVKSTGAESNSLEEEGSLVITTEGTTTVTFIATDNAGNVTEKSKTVHIDRSKPELSLIGNSDWTDAESVTISATADNSGSGLNLLQVLSTGADVQSLHNGNFITITEEGITTVTFTATDNAGNVTTVSKTVNIDRTAPEITDIEAGNYHEGAETIYQGVGEYLSTTDIEFSIEAISGLMGGSPLEYLEYCISDESLDVIPDSNWITINQDDLLSSDPETPLVFTIDYSENDQETFIYLRISDGLHKSNILERKVLYSNGKPQSPSIWFSNYGIDSNSGYLVTDSSPIFTITNQEVILPLEGYYYRLELVDNSTMESILVKESSISLTSSSLSFENESIPETETGTHYEISFRAIGINNIESDWVTTPDNKPLSFLVDNTPPDEFLFTGNINKNNSDLPEREFPFTVEWNIPTDQTAIALYYFLTNSSLNDNEITQDYIKENFQLTEYCSFDITGLGGSGHKNVYVAAVDTVDEVRIINHEFYYDLEAPLISPEIQENVCNYTHKNNYNNNCVQINLSGISDNAALNSAEITFTYIDSELGETGERKKITKNIALTPDPDNGNEYLLNTTIYDLPINRYFFVDIKITDKAGNSTRYNDNSVEFQSTEAEADSIKPEKIPVNISFDEWEIKADKSTDDSGNIVYENCMLFIPESVHLSDNNGFPISSFSLSEDTSISTELLPVFKAESLELNGDVNCIDYSINRISISRSYLECDITMKLPSTEDSFTPVTLNDINLKGNGEFDLHYVTLNSEEWSDDLSVEFSSFWPISYNTIKLLNNCIMVENGIITLEDNNPYTFGLGEIKLESFTLEPDLTISNANVIIPEEGAVLTCGNNQFTVNKAEIRDSDFLIREGTLDVELAAGNVVNIPVYNIKIDRDGNITGPSGISYWFNNSEENQITDPLTGYLYKISSLRFAGNNIYLNGSVFFNENSEESTGKYFTYLRLTHDGIDYSSKESKFSEVELNASGFSLSGDPSLRNDDLGEYWFFDEVEIINIPGDRTENTWDLTDLKVSLADSSGNSEILNSSKRVLDSVSNKLSRTNFNSRYQDVFAVKEYTLDSEGFHIILQLNLPEYFGEDKVIEIPADMDSSGSIFGEKETEPVSIGGVNGVLKSIDFDGTSLTADSLCFLELGNVNYENGLFFENFSFNSWSTGYRDDVRTFNYQKQGSVFTVSKMEIKENGLYADYFQDLSKGNIVSGALFYSDTKIPYNYTPSLTHPDNQSTVNMSGWEFYPYSVIYEDNGQIQFSGKMPLYETIASKPLVWDKITVSREGLITAAETSDSCRQINISSTNGFRGYSSSWILNDEGLGFNGTIYIPDQLDKTFSSQFSIETDGSIFCYDQEALVTYNFAGQTISGRGITLDRNGIKYDTSTFELAFPFTVNGENLQIDQEIHLLDVQFKADGTLLSSGRQDESVEIPVSEFALRINSVELEREGVSIPLFIEFPDYLGGEVIFFQSLMLREDGSLDSEDIIPELHLWALGLDLELKNICLSDNGLNIGEASLNLPDMLESQSLTMRGLRIGFDGSFNLGATADPIDLFDFEFQIDGLSRDVTGKWEFSGNVRLPYSLGGKDLGNGFGGNVVEISEFSYDPNEESLEKAVTLDVSITDTLFIDIEDWRIEVAGAGVEVNENGFVFKLSKGTLYFPDNLVNGEDLRVSVNSVGITDFTINFKTGDYTFGEISVVGVNLYAYGLIATVSEFYIADDMSFTVSGTAKVDSQSDFPEALKDVTLSITELSMDELHQLSTLDASLDFDTSLGSDTDPLKLFDGAIIIDKASFLTQYVDGELKLGLSDTVMTLGDNFPEGLAGSLITVPEGEEILFNFETMSFENFNLQYQYKNAASSDVLTLFEDGSEITLTSPTIHLYLDGDEEFHLDVSTESLRLPENAPGDFSEAELQSVTLELSSDGSFAFSVAMNSSGGNGFEVCSGVSIRDGLSLSLDYGKNTGVSFDFTGTFVFSEDIMTTKSGGLVTAETAFSLLGDGGYGFSIDVSELYVLDQFTVKDVGLSVSRIGTGSSTLSFGGKVVLPDCLQNEAAGTENTIGITKLTIADGVVDEVDISGLIEEINIIDQMALETGKVSVGYERATGNWTFDVDASVRFTEDTSTPEDLRGETIRGEVRVSTENGLESIIIDNTGSNPLDFEITGTGLKAAPTIISYDPEDGLYVGGQVTFMESVYPDGLGGKTVGLEASFDKDWKLTYINATLSEASCEFYGFEFAIEDLRVTTTYISVGKGSITLPEECGGAVGIRNGKISFDGKIEGELDKITVSISGFTLNCEGPRIDKEKGEVSFERVGLDMPEFVGNSSVELSDVRIGGDTGFYVGGGAFELPSFKLADGMEFALSASFQSLPEGGYRVGAAGTASVPGVGTFVASAVFRPKNEIYPWGLESAYFSYEIKGMGLPIGATGIYMNGIRGGLAFGPPNEVPSLIRPFFDDPGTRIQIGVTIADVTGGQVFRGTTDVWIDIENWSWAFMGNVTVLNGVVTSDIIAAVSSSGVFYGNIKVQIAFARGSVDIYIWKDGKKTLLSGRASVQIGISKGLICEEAWWHPAIPTKDYWLAGANADFGAFTYGGSSVNGIKAYVNVPIYGTLGVFYQFGGGLKLSGISSYRLRLPSGFKGESVALEEDPHNELTYLDGLGLDRTEEQYLFTVEGEEDVSRDFSQICQIEETERLIFYVGYPEGDPLVSVINDRGTEYREGSADVEVTREDWGLVFLIYNPEPGEYTINVENLAEGIPCNVMLFGAVALPEIEITSQSRTGEVVFDTIDIEGKAVSHTANLPLVHLYLVSVEEDGFRREIGTPLVSGDGTFTFSLDTNLYADGEYTIEAGVDDGEHPELTARSLGSMVITNKNPLLPMSNICLSPIDTSRIFTTDTDDFELETQSDFDYEPVVFFEDAPISLVRLTYDNPNKGLNVSNKLIISSQNGELIEDYDIGSSGFFDIPRLEEGLEYNFTITSSTDDGGEITSESVSYTYEILTEISNRFSFDAVETVEIIAGQSYELELTYQVDSGESLGDARDYMDGYTLEAPEGLSLNFPEDRWIVSDDGSLTVYLNPGETMEEGTYEVTLHFENMGTRDYFKEISIPLEVSYPQPRILDVEPDEWLTQYDTEISLAGEGFIPGTVFSLNGVELEIISMETMQASMMIPAHTGIGDSQLMVEGPSGLNDQMEVFIDYPDYSITAYKSWSRMNPGTRDSFYFSIDGFNDYEGEAYFTIDEVPEGWNASVTRNNISSGEMAEISVFVPEGSLDGTYNIIVGTDSNKEIELSVIVTGDEIAPHISSRTSASGYAGDEIILYGFGFDAGSIVSLEGQALSSTFVSSSMMKYIVDGNLTGGSLIVTSSTGLESDAVSFTLRSNSFGLYPSQTVIEMQPGEETEINLVLSGATYPVDLSVSSTNDQLYAVLDQSSSIPNSSTLISIEASSLIENGTYHLMIKGESVYDLHSQIVEITIGDVFSIEETELAEGMCEIPYSAEFTVANETGSVSYITNSALPSGLSLTEEGLLFGTPQSSGEYTLVIEAEDEAAHKAEQTFVLFIRENSWPQSGQNGGRTHYNPVPGPGGDSIDWTSEALGEGEKLLSSGDNIFVLTSAGVFAYNSAGGGLLYSRSGSYKDMLLFEENLYLLSEENNLTLVDSEIGIPVTGLFSSEEAGGIESITTDGIQLFIEREEDESLWGGNRTVFTEERACYPVENLLVEAETGEVFFEADSVIQNVCADKEGWVLLLENSTLLLDSNGEVLWTLPRWGRSAALSPEILYITGTFETLGVNRESGEILWQYAGARSVTAGIDKIFITGYSGLTALNKTTGKAIWTSSGDYVDCILSGQELYALRSDGQIEKYESASDSEPPELTFETSPAEEDGQNNYFITMPQLTLSAEDAEGGIEGIFYRISDGEWTLYEDPLDLDDGEYTMEAYAVDTSGKSSLTESREFLIDTSIPVTTSVISGGSPFGDYYREAPIWTLTAEDIGSGLERIEYNLGNGWTDYSEPLILSEEGEWTLQWKAVDRAGNVEEKGSLEIKVDLEVPLTSALTTGGTGYQLVYLTAEDSYSGIERIEYHLEEDPEVSLYEEPLFFSETGEYKLLYRAIDRAGKACEWESIAFTVSDPAGSDWIVDPVYSYYRHNYENYGYQIIRNVEEGSALFSPVNNWRNRIEDLPDYIKGADMILCPVYTRSYEGEDYITFTAGADIDLYILKHRYSGTDLNGWDLIDTDYPVNGHYFRGGADIYKRHYGQGERVSIPGPEGRRDCTGNLIFVQYSPAEAAQITYPIAGTTLTTLSTISYSGLVHPAETSRQWSVKIADGLWSDLGMSGFLELPYVAEDTELTLKLDVTLNDGTIRTSLRTYPLENPSELSIVRPVANTALYAEETVSLEATGIDAFGETAEIHWQFSLDGESWEATEDSLTVPDVPVLYLKAVIEEAPGHEKTLIQANPITLPESSKLVTFGLEPDTCDGQTVMVQQDGSRWGFLEDNISGLMFMGYLTKSYHENRWAQWYENVYVSEDYLNAQAENPFVYSLRNGSYTVRVRTTCSSSGGDLIVEDQTVSLQQRGRSIYDISIPITVTDNELSLSFTKNTPLFEIEIIPSEMMEDGAIFEDLDYQIVTSYQHWRRWR